MKKIILSLSLLLTAVYSFAIEPDFTLNEAELSQSFEGLNSLERFINENPDLSIDEIKAQNQELVENVSFESSAIVNPAGDMPIVGSFWWGCVLGIVGLVLVYFVTDNDKEQTKKALVGCVIGTLVFGGIWALSGSLTWF
jgi:hypothetical protein